MQEFGANASDPNPSARVVFFSCSIIGGTIVLTYWPEKIFPRRLCMSRFGIPTALSEKLSILTLAACLMPLGLSSHAIGQTVTTLYNFGSSTGEGTNPQAGLITDGAGNLYGTAALSTARADGSVF